MNLTFQPVLPYRYSFKGKLMLEVVIAILTVVTAILTLYSRLK